MRAIVNVDQLTAADRALLIERSQAARTRDARTSLAAFLDALVKSFRVDPAPNPLADDAARQHGKAMREQDFSVADVVHDYGALRQAIVELAQEREAPVGIADMAALGRRIDHAAGVAAGEFVSQHTAALTAEHEEDVNHRLGVFAHALRNHVTTATLAVHISRNGNAGLEGPSGKILDRSLKGLAQLIDRSLAEALLAHETVVEPEMFSLGEFIADLQASASLEADAMQCGFVVDPVTPGLALRGDRDLLLASVGSLLQNAFKFTRRNTEVRLHAHPTGERIQIDIEDNCGGLPVGGIERMFLPYGKRRGDQTGVGLGLSISRRSVEANGGTLTVRDVPGRGCVFTIDLPSHDDPAAPKP
jgi:signal transduction histidine kinase